MYEEKLEAEISGKNDPTEVDRLKSIIDFQKDDQDKRYSLVIPENSKPRNKRFLFDATPQGDEQELQGGWGSSLCGEGNQMSVHFEEA